MPATTDPQPARLTVDYPDRELDRISMLLRLVCVLPIAVVLGLVGTAASGESLGALAGGVLVLPVLFTILIRQKHPRWRFNFNVELTRLGARVAAYLPLDPQPVSRRAEASERIPGPLVVASPRAPVLLCLRVGPVGTGGVQRRRSRPGPDEPSWTTA